MWLIGELPVLADLPALLIHGERGERGLEIHAIKPASMHAFKPRVYVIATLGIVDVVDPRIVSVVVGGDCGLKACEAAAGASSPLTLFKLPFF